MSQWVHPQHWLEAVNYSLVKLRMRLAQLDKQTSNGALEIEREKIKEAIRVGEKLLESDTESNK